MNNLSFNQITLIDNQLILFVKRPNKIVLFLSVFFTAVFCLLPILIFISIAFSSDGETPFHFIQFVFLSIPILFGLFLLRLTLWNFYGKEVYNFENNEIAYYADYNWFKDSRQKLNLNSISFFVNPNKPNNKDGAFLLVKDETNSIESVVNLPQNQLEELIIKLNSNYTKEILN